MISIGSDELTNFVPHTAIRLRLPGEASAADTVITSVGVLAGLVVSAGERLFYTLVHI